MNKYVGHMSQLYSVEEHVLVGGKGNGLRLLEIRNGKGMELTLSLDRCCDISRLTYKGINMSYMSPCGYVAPSYYDKEGDNFLKSFTAGFMTTCGFNNVGNSGVDNGESLGLHGTIGNTPVSHYTYDVEGNKIHVKATISDEVLFAHKFVLTRHIYVSLLRNEFSVRDEIENTGDTTYPSLLLYHINIGHPLLSENCKLYINANSVTARNERAQEGIKTWNQMLAPIANFEEQCYFFKFKDNAVATVYNPDIKSGLAITFDSKVLPCFTEWKMMGEREYVLGLEPGNSYPGLRSEKRKDGSLITLKPGEKLSYNFTVTLFDKERKFNSYKEDK